MMTFSQSAPPAEPHCVHRSLLSSCLLLLFYIREISRCLIKTLNLEAKVQFFFSSSTLDRHLHLPVLKSLPKTHLQPSPPKSFQLLLSDFIFPLLFFIVCFFYLVCVLLFYEQ